MKIRDPDEAAQCFVRYSINCISCYVACAIHSCTADHETCSALLILCIVYIVIHILSSARLSAIAHYNYNVLLIFISKHQ